MIIFPQSFGGMGNLKNHIEFSTHSRHFSESHYLTRGEVVGCGIHRYNRRGIVKDSIAKSKTVAGSQLTAHSSHVQGDTHGSLDRDIHPLTRVMAIDDDESVMQGKFSYDMYDFVKTVCRLKGLEALPIPSLPYPITEFSLASPFTCFVWKEVQLESFPFSSSIFHLPSSIS